MLAFNLVTNKYNHQRSSNLYFSFFLKTIDHEISNHTCKMNKSSARRFALSIEGEFIRILINNYWFYVRKDRTYIYLLDM